MLGVGDFDETIFWVSFSFSTLWFKTFEKFLKFSDPISCQADEKIKSVIETKCWIEGVYIDKKLLFGTIGKDITRYGVGARVVSNARLTKQQIEDNFKQDFIYQNYYQWVVPVLLLQALILYAPRLLWHIWENGLMENLIDRTG